MAFQHQPHPHRQCGSPVWAWPLLLLAATALEILNVENMISGSWATMLNTLLTGVNVILVLLQWYAQTPTEAYSLSVSCVSAAHGRGQRGCLFQRRRHKSAERAISPHQKRRKVIRHLLPDFQDTTLSIKAVSHKVKRNLPHERMKVTPMNQRPCVPLLRASAGSLSTTAARTYTNTSRVSAEVLLVSVTDSEAQAILTVFPSAIKTVIQNRTYYSLGRVGQTRTYMVQATGMGPAGVRTCIEDGIRTLSPKAIILVGIAFGLQADRQQLGDVLVSRQIQDYDPQRYGTGSDQQPVIHLRGNRMTATEWLIDRFSAGKHDWHGPAAIHIGLLLSGSLLIDHYETRERLLHLAPEALGGEMEGATLCEVALRNHVGWIVVKAIADWADGNKRQDEQEQQKRAAENAAQFVYHVLRQPGFIQKKE